MSVLSQVAAARPRVPRFAEAAVQRARLSVVPQRALGSTQAARTPFVVLVIGLLVAGVVGLLMFNTHMQQASFRATALQTHAAELTAKQQALNMELDELRDPQRLADSAQELGMVAPSQPAFIQLSDGRVLGTPAKATLADAVRINSLPTVKPKAINPRPLIIRVPAPRVPATTDLTNRAALGAASTDGTAPDGRKKVDR